MARPLREQCVSASVCDEETAEKLRADLDRSLPKESQALIPSPAYISCVFAVFIEPNLVRSSYHHCHHTLYLLPPSVCSHHIVNFTQLMTR